MATITISLPDQVAQKVDAEAKSKGFSTRSEFVRSLLRKYFVGEHAEFEIFEPRPIDEVRFELAKSGKYSQEFIDSVAEGLRKSSAYAN